MKKNFGVIIDLGKKIDLNFWDGFTPVSESNIEKLECEINRKLPEDFKYFYSHIGFGYFPDSVGGDIQSPEEIINNCHAPYYFVTGSMTSGEEWASNEAQRRFYITYGKENPNPKMFSKESMFLDGVFILDLIQIGSDGCCCYHQLNVGEQSEFKYCLLTDSSEIENKAISFYEGLSNYLKNILEQMED